MSDITILEKSDILLSYYSTMKYWIRNDFYLKRISNGIETIIKYPYSNFCDKNISELIIDINVRFNRKEYGLPEVDVVTEKEVVLNKENNKENNNNNNMSKRNKGGGRGGKRHTPTINCAPVNKKKTGRIRKINKKLISDAELSERKNNIRNILTLKGLCQIQY